MSKSPSERSPTMTTVKDKPAAAAIKDLLSQSPDALRRQPREKQQQAHHNDAVHEHRQPHVQVADVVHRVL